MGKYSWYQLIPLKLFVLSCNLLLQRERWGQVCYYHSWWRGYSNRQPFIVLNKYRLPLFFSYFFLSLPVCLNGKTLMTRPCKALWLTFTETNTAGSNHCCFLRAVRGSQRYGMCIFLVLESHAALTGLSGAHVDVALKLRGKIRVNCLSH